MNYARPLLAWHPQSNNRGKFSSLKHWLLAALLSLVLSFAIPSLIEPALAVGANNLGATFDATQNNVTFRVYSNAATHLEVWLYDQNLGAAEKFKLPLTQDSSSKIWSVSVPVSTLKANGITDTIYYGYRAWGPNWTYDPSWTQGSTVGFVRDVDGQGNRFNPNKLLLDPYAVEVSHDRLIPTATGQTNGGIYVSGPEYRAFDTGSQAPKGIVLPLAQADIGNKPTRPFKDEIIYEVHLRGLTENDPDIPENLRGTYAGAALKAKYLKDLGVSAVEFLPLQSMQNDTNDLIASTAGDNYWGYDPYNYFAADRRYAADKTPGGPTQEFQQMTKAFHEQGLKVYVDVVYNHTGEEGVDTTGNISPIFTMRGLDNPTYYELSNDVRYYYSDNGVGPNLNTGNPVVRDLIIDSLAYWKDTLGVDGFRFDLAPVIGNDCQRGCFQFNKFNPDNALNRMVKELPVRPANGGNGADLIAEPWAVTNYQMGNFPSGWAEWNDKFRDSFRKAQNRLGVENVPPNELATRFAGSRDLFQDDGRKPWHSVNFIVAHDGFTLRDVYNCNQKTNSQLTWDQGPSDGGTDNNLSWDQGGEPSLQRQATRTALALEMLSAGVPMMTGGDEMYRTQYCNNNMYNVDSAANWLNYDNIKEYPHFFNYSQKLLAFRNAHPALRPADFFQGTDNNGNGLKDLTWLRSDGNEPDSNYFSDPNQHFLAYRLDGSELGDDVQSIYVAYNSWSGNIQATLPPNLPGKQWYRVADTASFLESQDNFNAPGAEELLTGSTYDVNGRSLLLLIEK